MMDITYAELYDMWDNRPSDNVAWRIGPDVWVDVVALSVRPLADAPWCPVLFGLPIALTSTPGELALVSRSALANDATIATANDLRRVWR